MSEEHDFFVSYTGVDTGWAEWIAWTLEKDGGYTTRIQAWDFAPGTNFVVNMDDGLARSRRIIAVLSPAYLRSAFATAEWTAAFTKDALGVRRHLIPIMVEKCDPGPLLSPIVHARLFDLDQAQARGVLLRAVSGRTGTRPSHPPVFPGQRSASGPAAGPSFPGAGEIAVGDRGPAGLPERGDREQTPLRPGPVPWVPLPAASSVRWGIGPVAAAEPAAVGRLEFHLLPGPAAAGNSRLDIGAVGGSLVDSGRRTAIFPAAATIDVRLAGDQVAAVVANADGVAEAGLCAGSDGRRSAWLMLPPAGTTSWPSAVLTGLGKLLAAVTSSPPVLPAQIMFAVAIGEGVKLAPRAWIWRRDLTGHADQITDSLSRELITAATDVRG